MNPKVDRQPAQSPLVHKLPDADNQHGRSSQSRASGQRRRSALGIRNAAKHARVVANIVSRRPIYIQAREELVADNLLAATGRKILRRHLAPHKAAARYLDGVGRAAFRPLGNGLVAGGCGAVVEVAVGGDCVYGTFAACFRARAVEGYVDGDGRHGCGAAVGETIAADVAAGTRWRAVMVISTACLLSGR